MTDNTPARTTVRGAVEKADAAPSMAAAIRQAIEQQSASIAQVLPKGHDADRFTRILLTAVKANPKLVECFSTEQGRTSVLLSAMQCATVGLEPNTPTQDCWLEPRRNKGTMECRVAYGYRGLLKLARRSGEIKSVVAEAVYERDHFVFRRGTESDLLEHEAADGDRGQLTHAFAILRYFSGGYDIVVLGKQVIEAQHRARSEGWKFAPEKSPWTTDTAAMWQKTALREVMKRGPQSLEMASAISTDDRPLGVDDGVIVATIADDMPELGAGE
jgi:recombination protein RecT